MNGRAEFHIFQDLLAPKVLFTSPNPEITIHPSNPMAIPIQVNGLLGYMVIILDGGTSSMHIPVQVFWLMGYLVIW